MAHWGIAYAMGPNYNDPMSSHELNDLALTHCRLALEDSELQYEPDRLMIEALQNRYLPDVILTENAEERGRLNIEYADSMRVVYQKFSRDSEVIFFYAESVMNICPWAMWTKEMSKHEYCDEITSTITEGLLHFNKHPGLCHLAVHAWEMSPTPENALEACEHLRTEFPDAGHLLHMPSHIDVLLGDWQKAIDCNQSAYLADEQFHRLVFSDYYSLYRFHNLHFIVYAANFVAQYSTAVTASDIMLRMFTPRLQVCPYVDMLEPYTAMKLHVYIRFGKWEEILNEPFQGNLDLFEHRTTIQYYARGLAYASTNRPDLARNEQIQFIARKNRGTSRSQFFLSMDRVLEVAEQILEGEILYREGKYNQAFYHLRNAVHLDDHLPFIEPWGWMMPARHALGALLLEQGKTDEAEKTYRDDLKKYPKNVWSMHGLIEITALKNPRESQQLKRELAMQTKLSDFEITASCACRIGRQQVVKLEKKIDSQNIDLYNEQDD